MDFTRQAGRWVHVLTESGTILCSGAFIPDPKKGWMVLRDPGDDLCGRCRVLLTKRERAGRIQKLRAGYERYERDRAQLSERTFADVLLMFEIPEEFSLMTVRRFDGHYASVLIDHTGVITRQWSNAHAATVGHRKTLDLIMAKRTS